MVSGRDGRDIPSHGRDLARQRDRPRSCRTELISEDTGIARRHHSHLLDRSRDSTLLVPEEMRETT